MRFRVYFEYGTQVFPFFFDYHDMDGIGSIIVDGVTFGRTCIGLITRPYETYRRILHHGKVGELGFIAVLLGAYFALASIVKVAAFRPFLLTQQFIVLVLGAISGALVATVSLFVAGRVLGAKAKLEVLLLAWSYTLVPTVCWFLATSLLYLLLPPPRTTSALGITFSLLFLVFSATLLWWKVTLSYLTIRFGLKLSFGKSILVALMCAPGVFVWAWLMYLIGVFKVPFL